MVWRRRRRRRRRYLYYTDIWRTKVEYHPEIPGPECFTAKHRQINT
jgi:hypothetical protein